MIVAVDGPVAAGKGTLARRLAAELGFAFLDTGALYRAVALKLLRQGADPADEEAAVAAARGLRPQELDDPALREECTGEAASQVSQMTPVRQALLEYQRDFAANPPEGAAGAVLDGRDIGTVVCPEADVKLFVTASAEERARRRWQELRGRGEEVALETVLADLRQRDERDMSRAVSPLMPAADAHLLDTTNLDIDAAFAAAKAIVAGHRSQA